MTQTANRPLQLDTVARAGLGRVGRRLREGQPVTVAYFGGSITWGGKASDIEKTSYRALTTAWLRTQFPDAAITEVNAAIGGTGSDLGAYRLRQDVLRHKPDVVFIEFAVNDQGTDPAVTRAAFEGIVRHARRACPNADLCLVYTLCREHLPLFEKSEVPAPIAVHEAIADHYGLPSVHMGRAVARDLQAGTLSWETFSTDTCHPTDAGFAHYARTLQLLLPTLFEMPALSADAASLPAPLNPEPWEHADLRAMTPQDAAGAWRYTPQQFKGGWDYFHGLLECDTVGADLTLPFTGTTVGLLYQLGPESGDITVAVDDGEPQTVRVFDQYSPSFWRPHYRVLFSGLKPGPHTLRVRLAESRDPPATGHTARVGYVLSR